MTRILSHLAVQVLISALTGREYSFRHRTQKTRWALADRATAPVGTAVFRPVLVDVAVEDLGDLLDFGLEFGEFGGEDGLHAVGEGFFRLVMDFD